MTEKAQSELVAIKTIKVKFSVYLIFMFVARGKRRCYWGSCCIQNTMYSNKVNAKFRVHAILLVYFDEKVLCICRLRVLFGFDIVKKTDIKQIKL